jgi:RNA polymerase sigma factor for flagellar operon FliA
MRDGSDRGHGPSDGPDVLARVQEAIDLVRIIAHQVKRQLGPTVRVDELASYGHEGLLIAARTYDAARGVPFRRWASLRVRGAILDGVRSTAGLPRGAYRRLRALEASDAFQEAAQEESAGTPTATPEAADARLGSFLEGMAMAMAMAFVSKTGAEVDHAVDPSARQDDELMHAELRETIRSAIANRPEQERILLEAHYFEDKTLEQAAAQIGLSKSWASRLHARALEGIAKDLKRQKFVR